VGGSRPLQEEKMGGWESWGKKKAYSQRTQPKEILATTDTSVYETGGGNKNGVRKDETKHKAFPLEDVRGGGHLVRKQKVKPKKSFQKKAKNLRKS